MSHAIDPAITRLERETAAESAEAILRTLLTILKITGAHHG
jgi:hypothetical protein